jgi:hypothetical protein
MSFWYLATPYAKYPGGPDIACENAAIQASILIKEGIKIFCPITHSHAISRFTKHLEDPHRFWLDFDKPFMKLAKGLIICKLTGYKDSRGIAEEFEYFQSANKPIVYMEPYYVPQMLLAEKEPT